jgi:hypothetical protein
MWTVCAPSAVQLPERVAPDPTVSGVRPIWVVIERRGQASLARPISVTTQHTCAWCDRNDPSTWQGMTTGVYPPFGLART